MHGQPACRALWEMHNGNLFYHHMAHLISMRL